MPQRYKCFGLTVHSAVRLPCTASGTGTPDVHVEVGEVSPIHFDTPTQREATIEEHVIHLQIPSVGRFAIRDGTNITVDRQTDATDHELQSYLLGSILGILLHQRAGFVLHGSTVTIEGHTVALIGERTQGKSTLAAALVSEGGQLVADDKSVLKIDTSAVDVRTGPPILKITPDVADGLNGPFEAISPVLQTGKRLYRVLETRLDAGTLDRIYILDDGEGHPTIDSVPLGERVEQVMRNIYLPELVGESGTLERHFEESTTLVRQVPVKRLSYPRRMDALSSTCETIERDLHDD